MWHDSQYNIIDKTLSINDTKQNDTCYAECHN